MGSPDYTLWVPKWHPPLENVYRAYGSHWRIVAARVKATRNSTAWVIRNHMNRERVPDAEGKRRIGLVGVMGKGQRTPDVDAYWKCFLDAAQDARLITNDNEKGVEILPVVFDRNWKNPGTRILIWEME